ncbi:MAG: hypothetical protein WBV80_08770 [Mycobacterium sp.]
MAAMLPSTTCTPALREAGCFPVANGDLHMLQAVGAAHAAIYYKVLDNGTCP